MYTMEKKWNPEWGNNFYRINCETLDTQFQECHHLIMVNKMMKLKLLCKIGELSLVWYIGIPISYDKLKKTI